MKSSIVKKLLPIIIGLAVYLIPVPSGLTNDAWIYLSLFIAVIAGLIIEPLPAAFVGLVGVIVAVVLKIGAPYSSAGIVTSASAIKWGLSGFSNTTVWLIFAAFMMAAGYEKSGLGKRVSLLLVKKMGKTSLGLAYSLTLTETILAPFVPSNAARSGILYPILKSIPLIYNSTPEHEPKKVGSYLSWVGLLNSCITSSLFFTALAPSIMAGGLINAQGIQFTWMQWFIGMAPAGILLLLVSPYLAYLIYPPQMKRSEDTPAWAAEELKKMGPLTSKEILMALSAILALVLWVGAKAFGVNATTTALIILSLITLMNIITWGDILGNKAAWSVFLWFGTLVTLASGLKNVGFLDWFAQSSSQMLVDYSASTVLIGLLVIFFVSHYFFASVTSHVAALLILFLTTALPIVGLPPTSVALLFGYTLGLMGILTPYGTGSSPIIYGLGFIPAKDFWFLGAVFGALFLFVFLVITVPWVQFLGF